MKNWDERQWVKFLFGLTVFFFLNTYIIGAFVLKQETNEINLQLRVRIIDLLSFIAAQLLAEKTTKNNNNGKDKET